jgi:hypothetical protein
LEKETTEEFENSISQPPSEAATDVREILFAAEQFTVEHPINEAPPDMLH